LNVRDIVIRDSEGERRFASDALPLRIGTGNDCELRLPGPGGQAVALLDELDGAPFIQPVGSSSRLTVNDEPLNTSRRISAGDSLEFFGSRVLIAEDDGVLSLDVRLEASAYVTRPPEIANSADQPAEETIVATAFKRAATDSGRVEARSSGPRWKAIASVAMVLLVGVSWLLFTSKSIQFDVQPAGSDSVDVRGGWFKLPVGNRYLLRQGTYTVDVEKKGYYDVSQTVEVDETPSRTIVVEMRRLPGKLVVRTDPATDAVVTVDDTQIGKAPFGPLELEPGTHSVVVTADRFLPYRERLQVPGLDVTQELTVQLVPQWANVELKSEPSGADVFRGTTKIGETPISLELLEGSHSLSVIKDGFKAWDGAVDAEANVDQVLPVIELEPANAELRVVSIPRAANVTINGRYRGQSPVTIALSPDIDYRVGLSKAGYGSTSRQVRLAAAASEEITVDMTARLGDVTVNVLPGDAVVYVDGQARGTGSSELKLSAAPHRLEVRKDGYVTFARSITPRPGYPQTVNVRLLSDAELAAQSTARTLTTSQGQELRRIEPGDFVMGTSRREQGRRANEVLLPVLITKPYYLGSKEVTNREFRRFRSNHDSGGALHVALAGDLNPVVNVSWQDAVEYCNWLSAHEGLEPVYEKKFERWQPILPTPNGYRLPTEAEWAWAIRYQGRNSATTFPWGARLPPRRDSGNFADKSANALVPSIIPGWDDGFASTAPVGSFAPNALGIHDGGGNVAEWVQDYYSVPTPGQSEPIEDPQGPLRGSSRVIRGSSWMHAGMLELRSAYRAFGNNPRPDVGFRIARNADL